MISEVCALCRNYFIRDYVNPDRYIHHGTFTIENGGIVGLTFLQPNQYYRVVGSVFNDGVWKYGTDVLTDETFTGSIWEMAVPKDFADLCKEIADWTEANAGSISSPYQSESFGGYSYTLKAGGGASGDAAFGWQNQFAGKLSRWRRLTVL